MRVNGSCHCGQITYEAEVDPDRAGLCNCTDCQVLTADSTGQRNGLAEHLSRRLVAKSLPWPLVQLSRDRVELGL